MKKLLAAAAVAAALLPPAAALASSTDDKAVRLRIELPIVGIAPTPDCPPGTFFALDYGVSLRGKTAQARNCIVGFTPIDCAPSVCADVAVVMMFHLPGGTITARGDLFEKAPCDPATGPECTLVEQTWSGTVTEARGRFHTLVGGIVSGGGTAVYRFPPDDVEPFASIDEVLVISPGDE